MYTVCSRRDLTIIEHFLFGISILYSSSVISQISKLLIVYLGFFFVTSVTFVIGMIKDYYYYLSDAVSKIRDETLCQSKQFLKEIFF